MSDLFSSIYRYFIEISSRQFIELSQPKDLLADEELAPYITKLLYQDFGPWSTRISALLMNIKLESNHKRTVDRSLKQCEYVMQMIEGKEVPIKQRFFFHLFCFCFLNLNSNFITDSLICSQLV